jgi:hypothetical protein
MQNITWKNGLFQEKMVRAICSILTGNQQNTLPNIVIPCTRETVHRGAISADDSCPARLKTIPCYLISGKRPSGGLREDRERVTVTRENTGVNRVATVWLKAALQGKIYD